MRRIALVRPHHDSRGATTIELILLLVLIVILAALAIPGVSPVVQQLRLRGAAWQVAGDLRLARQRAVTLKRPFRICVAATPSVPNSDCQVNMPLPTYSFDQNSGTGNAPVWVSETGAVRVLPQDVTVQSNQTPVFSGTGNAAPAATLTVTNLMGTYEIKVAATGRVLVCQGACP
jgi:Tfp pilus assembly protein FimT